MKKTRKLTPKSMLKIMRDTNSKEDKVNSPDHYTKHPSGVECITITEHFNFNIGNAIKYLWRTDAKEDPIVNLQKAQWYVNRELARRGVR